jgi:hypothetical protein
MIADGGDEACVGDVKRRASIMSGGLVIQRPATWTTTAVLTLRRDRHVGNLRRRGNTDVIRSQEGLPRRDECVRETWHDLELVAWSDGRTGLNRLLDLAGVSRAKLEALRGVDPNRVEQLTPNELDARDEPPQEAALQSVTDRSCSRSDQDRYFPNLGRRNCRVVHQRVHFRSAIRKGRPWKRVGHTRFGAPLLEQQQSL